MGGDAADFVVDAEAEEAGEGGVAELAVVGEGAIRVGMEIQAAEAEEKLGEILDDPAEAEWPGGERVDAAGVDEVHGPLVGGTARADEEVAEVEVLVVEPLGVEAGGELHDGRQGGGDGGGGELVGRDAAGEVVGDEERPAVGELAVGDEGDGGDAVVAEEVDAADFTLHVGGVAGEVTFYVPAMGYAVWGDEIEGGVLAFGEVSPEVDPWVGEDGLRVQA